MASKKTEALEVHTELNPKLWDGMTLKEDVKNKLLEIANTFIEGLDYPLNVADIRFLGSNASFNYNDNSDIDLHIISNFELSYVDKDILQILYNASKNSFNNHHDITIHDIPVELYIEDMHSINATNGAYSLLQDDWVMIPKPITYEIPDYSKELNDLLEEIHTVLESGSKAEIEELINRIYLGRKDGLATVGEASIGNCVFKELRNMGLMDELRQRFYDLESEELTLENKLVEANEQLDNLTNDLVDDMQEDSDAKQIEEKTDEYKEYIDTHIENVRKAYDRIVKPLIEDEFTGKQIKDLEHNLEIHDEDKSIPFMFDAYRRDHYPINDKEKEDAEEDYDIAWDYHKHNNPHHWEYWLNSNGDFALNPDLEAMKVAYAEMFCDWLSFGFRKEDTSATGESTEFETWYDEAKENIKIHPDLQEWYDDKITKIIDFIRENKDTLYESVGLTNLKTCDKIEEDVNNNVKVGESKVKKITEDSYKDYRNNPGFDLEYNVKVPIKAEQEDDFDSFEDDMGRDIEMELDIDSLYDGYEEAQKQIESFANDEDWLKEIFPTVGLGRVYIGNVYLDEDVLDFDIGFSSIVDPVEKGNEIRLDENELKEQIKDLAEGIIDNVDWISARQCYEVPDGLDEDDEPAYEIEYSDSEISFSLHIDESKSIEIKSIVTESKKLQESNLSRIFSHYSNTPFAIISAERTREDNETEEEAKARNKRDTLRLKNDIRSERLGYIPVDGSWKEDGSVSSEASFFIPMSTGNYDSFFKWAISMCNEYKQYSVLISDGKGNIAYYDRNGNVDMEFKGGISFNQQTIDSNIEKAGGVGGYTSLNKKKPNKSFQLQEDIDLDDLVRYNTKNQREYQFNKKYNKNVVINDADDNYAILSKYVNADYGYINAKDLKFIIKTLYGKDISLEPSTDNVIDLGDVELTYSQGRVTSIKRK